MDGGRLARPSRPRGRVTNNGSKHDAIVSRFDQSGILMTMKAAAKALGRNESLIQNWRVGGRSLKGRFVPTNPAKQGALGSLMGSILTCTSI